MRFYNDSFIPRDNKRDEENKRDWPGIFQPHEKRKEKMAASAFVGGSQKNVMDVSSTSASCKRSMKESSNALEKRVLGT